MDVVLDQLYQLTRQINFLHKEDDDDEEGLRSRHKKKEQSKTTIRTRFFLFDRKMSQNMIYDQSNGVTRHIT